MKLEQRIDLLSRLGEYCLSADPAWEAAKQRAHAVNGWFIPEFIDSAVQQIVAGYLQRDKLWAWARAYGVAEERTEPRTMERVAEERVEPRTVGRVADEKAEPRIVGLVMAGNIPLVGFHDLLCVFLSGHRQLIKPSGRDEVLIRHVVDWMTEKDARVGDLIALAERLNGCDAYIATGSNNSARYFEYYFGKYPHIIRRNRTSVAVLTGQENAGELEALADDVNQYFGLGCRNVTQLLVPPNYDFLPLLEAFRKYDHLADLAKYKHNYDYQLTLLIMNKKYYMTNGSILLTENESPFSAISVLHYRYYEAGNTGAILTGEQNEIQCVVGQGHIPFGRAQRPELTDYADGVDTMEFLRGL